MNNMIMRAEVLLLREWFRVKKTLGALLLHYAVLWPTFFALSTGYFSAVSLFGEQSVTRGTEMFLGATLLHVALVSFVQTVPVLKERFGGKIVQYHVMTNSFFVVFFARYCFAVILSMLLLAPCLPVAKLVLGNAFYTEQVVWIKMYGVFFVIVTFMVSYIFFWIGCLQSLSKMGSVWKRFVEPLLWLGGLWAPGYAIIKAFPRFKLLIQSNPFFYASEAFRGVFFQNELYTPLTNCILILIGFSCLFTFLSYRLMYKRLEAV